MSDLEKFRNEQLQDPEFRACYNELEVFSDIAKAMVAGRLQNDLTQKELAKLSGIPQGNISRLESMDGNPSIKTLNRIAKAMNMRIKIEFVPIPSEEPSEEIPDFSGLSPSG